MRRTIAYFSNSYIPSTSANSVHTMKICSAFAEHFDNVILFSRKGKKKLENKYEYYGVKPNFKIIENYWPKFTRFSGFIYATQNRIHLKNNLSNCVLYGRNAYSLFLQLNACAPIVYESHQLQKTKLQTHMEKNIFNSKNFNHLVVISKPLKEHYIDAFPQLKGKVVVASDAADDMFYEGNPVKNLKGLESSIKIGYFGSLYRGRGINLILKIAERCSNAEFHIIGGQNEEIKKFKNKTKCSNIYFYGHIPHGLLPGYYAKMDILIAPYRDKVAVYGGKGDTSQVMSPLKIFEYMASGKAIVTSNLKVLKEVLDDGYNCILCEPNNLNQWTTSINNLILNNNLRFKLGKNARVDFLNNYTWKKRAQKVLGGLI